MWFTRSDSVLEQIVQPTFRCGDLFVFKYLGLGISTNTSNQHLAMVNF